MLAAMNADGDNSISIARCDPARDKSVLALAALAWPEAVRAEHWQAVGASLSGGSPGSAILLAAWEDDRLLGAALAQPLAGKAAVIWPPQILVGNNAERCQIAARLLARLHAELSQTGIRLAQCLLAADDHAATALLQAGGFAPAAELLYLAASAHEFPTQPLRLPFAAEAFDIAELPRLARLIERTYVGTLDCPQIDGLREPADVIAGYQGVGQFRPELWQFVRHENEDVGCVLVNLHPDVGHAEIVYLAIAPEVRGRGWGLELARHAQWLAGQAACEQTVLAVDAANEPAIRVYAAAGFREFDRKTVWIKSLR
jgi:mycothiol synthase